MAEPEEISLKDEIGLLCKADPFGPFAIVMGSGVRYEIARDTAVSVGKSVVFVARRGGGRSLLRLSQVSEVDVYES